MPRVVYDTEMGRVCPACQRAVADCSCRAGAAAGGDGVVAVRREKRRGKWVTVAAGFAIPRAELGVMAKELKRRFGTGGSVSAGSLELQGDYRDALVGELQGRGFVAKPAGGRHAHG